MLSPAVPPEHYYVLDTSRLLCHLKSFLTLPQFWVVTIMKHNHGIRVTLRDYWSDKLTEYPNPYQKRHVQYQGAFGSRLVTLHSDQQFQVHVTFDDHFELTTADGVLVVIAAGSEAEFPSKNWNPNKTGSRTVALSQRDHRQSYWIDAQNLNSQRTFMFSFLRLWELDIDNPRQDEIKWRMPQPDCEFMLNVT